MFNFMVEPILSNDEFSRSKSSRGQQNIEQDTWLVDEREFRQCYCPYCNADSNNHSICSKDLNLNTNNFCRFAIKQEQRDSDSSKARSFLFSIPFGLINQFKIINLKCSHYSSLALCCFFLNVIINCFFSIKLLVYSLISVDNQNSTEQTISANKHQLTITNTGYNNENNLSTLINEFIFCDIFQQFTNRRTINLVAASLLLPSTMNRIWCFFKLLHKITRNTNKRVNIRRQIRSGCESSKIDYDDISCNNREKESSKNVELNEDQTINVVQLNVAYLDSLQTTTSCWIQLFKDGWSHVHPMQKFDKETNLSIKICLSKGILPSCINLRTKMYSYNMIQFNDCYSKYFKPISGIDFSDHKSGGELTIEKFSNKNSLSTNSIDDSISDGISLYDKSFKHDREISPALATINICQEIKYCTHLLTLDSDGLYDPLARNLVLNERKNPLERISEQLDDTDTDTDINTDIDIEITNREKKKYSFVARPIHRLDLNEMTWLILLIMILYCSVFMQTIIPCALTIIIETNGAILDQVSPWSTSMFRWIQTATLQLLFVLTTFDLYNFVSCCLICISRAKYVRLHLKNLRESCVTIRCENLAINNIDTGSEKEDDYERENDYFMEQLKQVEAVEESGITMKLINKFEDHFRDNRDKQVTFEDTQLHDLNRRLETLIDRSLLVQKELNDLKSFFTIFLDFEIASKVLCSTFSLSALLDQRNTFEILYIFFNSLTGAVPIVITLTMAAFVEHEFRKICKEMSQLLVNGTQILTIKNIRQLMVQSNHLAAKSNRSMTIAGNFSLSMGSLVSVIGWVATSLVLFRR